MSRTTDRPLIDACGRRVCVPTPVQRVICLCPSLTETLCALGIGERLVGRTRYCVHPADALQIVADVGGTKQIDHAAVAALQPDLIIAEKEENRAEDVERLARRWPVFVCEIQDLLQAEENITQLGELIGTQKSSDRLRLDIASAWAGLQGLQPPLSALYLIWRKPWMAAGRTTYIDAVMQHCGLQNVAAELPGRYPQLSAEQLRRLQPQICLLSSEPYPFKPEHAEELQALLGNTRVEFVDGEMFSWYGARMLPAAEYLRARIQFWRRFRLSDQV